MAQWRVLVVEDDPVSQVRLLDALRESGRFRGYGAGDVAQAVELLDHFEFAFDGILLDTSLPDRDAHLLCRGLRDAGFHEPIIIMSAKIGRRAEQRSLDHGATAHFAKPVRVKDLLERLAAFIVGAGQAT
jgi:DNA-binding response OmpR family regulator